MFNINMLKKILTSKKMINLYYIFLIGTIILLLARHFLNSIKESCVENYQCGSPPKKESSNDRKKRCFKESLSISEQRLNESQNSFNYLVKAAERLEKDLKLQTKKADNIAKGGEKEKSAVDDPENVKLNKDNPGASLD